ncbi:transposon TX1 [Tanacetum coccineum]
MWMIFKKYGPVFDMFMAKRRIHNGQRYGFVRYKFVRDVESLLTQLQRIKMGADWLRVFHMIEETMVTQNQERVTLEWRVEEMVSVKQERVNVNIENRGNNSNDQRGFAGEGNSNNMDNQGFVDVVNNGNNKDGANKFEKSTNGVGVQPNSNEVFTMVRDKKWTGRSIQVEENDINSVILERSFVGEVKALCFHAKLLVLCEEQGLGKIEVKLLGGL